MPIVQQLRATSSMVTGSVTLYSRLAIAYSLYYMKCNGSELRSGVREDEMNKYMMEGRKVLRP